MNLSGVWGCRRSGRRGIGERARVGKYGVFTAKSSMYSVPSRLVGHRLPALKRKPGAFARWVLRDAMSPHSEYARTWAPISTATDKHARRPGAARIVLRSIPVKRRVARPWA